MRASEDRLAAWPPGLGKYYTFACIPVDLSTVDFSVPDRCWVVIEAEMMSRDGERRDLAATTLLEVSPLPRPDGWHPGDPHLHTLASDGWLTVEETVQCGKYGSGLSWMVITDHAEGIEEKMGWGDYVAECEGAGTLHDVLVCPGAECTATGTPLNGHALGYALNTAGGSGVPAASGKPATVISSILGHKPGTSFAGIAHPYHWLYRWPDWSVDGFRTMELATGGGAGVDRRTRERWFRLLRDSLADWSESAQRPDFVVGLSSTDSHAIPLSVMPGERHVTWVRTGSTTAPSGPADLYARMREGRCVVSCGGDFASLSLNGSGPGEVCECTIGSKVKATFLIQPRATHRLDYVHLRNSSGEVIKKWDSITGDSFADEIDAPTKRECFVAEFAFAGSGKERWEVWTNPVWVRAA